MNLPQLLFGCLLFGVAICFTSAAFDIGKDLITGEARRLGMFITGIGVLVLILSLVVLLVYIGYHGIIGKLDMVFLK